MAEPSFYVDQARPHLGGYIIGGDPATYYPDLWEWIAKECGVTSVLDLGCGEGHALRFFKEAGIQDLLGVDGVKQDLGDIPFVEHDFMLGELVFTRQFDLCWCCEFVEHIPGDRVWNFLPTFSSAQVVLMTHAGPGQAGHHHVNCQKADYWVSLMEEIGFSLDREITDMTRELAARNTNPYNHYARSGIAFVS